MDGVLLADYAMRCRHMMYAVMAMMMANVAVSAPDRTAIWTDRAPSLENVPAESLHTRQRLDEPAAS